MAQQTSHTFLFADLAGFTALTEAMGDEDAADVAGEFCAAVRDLAPDYGAEPIKSIGDALMLRGEQAADAIRFALHVVNRIGGRHFHPTVRVGMHTGPATERAGDWFGGTVNIAARVSGLAAGGEVLLTEATLLAAGSLEGVEVEERGRRSLKNIGEPVLLWAAAERGERSDAGLPIDPVCRMAVDPRHAAGSLEFGGTEFHFCPLECAGRFAANPDRYARTSPARAH